MRRTRIRLINAARRSMIERAELRRTLGIARVELAPGALVKRGKYRASRGINEAAAGAKEQFSKNRLPIALAAAAGLAWLFREPIKEHAPRIAGSLRDMADRLTAQFRAAGRDQDTTLEEDDETAE